MSNFQLSQQALRDLYKIRHRLQRKANVRVADMVEDAIFEGILECERLVVVGRPRDDIRDKSLMFHYVYQYAIVFRRDPDVSVLRVIHGARNMPKRIAKS